MRVQDVGILIIDDVNSMRVQIKDLLKKIGFEKIEMAENGAEAQKCLEKNQFQLVLSDWYMNPVNGKDLLEYIRTHPTHKDLAFIMVTAENTREMVIDAITSGVDEYIMKPLTVAQTHEKIFKVLLKKKVLS